MRKAYKKLTYADRQEIEQMSERGEKPKAIADATGVCFQTIYRELQRGKVVEKNEGRKIGYELEGSTLWIGDAIAMRLPRLQTDDTVKKDICADADGNLVFGLGENYVAQVEIPPKEYEYIEGETDAEGKKTVERVQKDFDISKCTLILWSIEEVYINE